MNLVIEFAPERINEATGSDGRTLLHSAACGGQEAAVSLLLSAKANVNQTDRWGRTPLYWTMGDQVKHLLRDAGGH